MKKLIIGILAVVGLLSILAVVAAAGFGLLTRLGAPRVPGNVVLEIDFEQPLIEAIPEDPAAKFLLEEVVEIRDVVDALDKAASDDRVKGLVARIGGGGIGLAHLQEIRDAVLRFRESGKPATAFSETFGEAGPGNGGYYLASAFDEIHMQPSGDVGLTGLLSESLFLRGTLDKLGVTPRIGQRYEFKNAANAYNERKMTPAHREAAQALLDSRFDQLVRGIAEGRGMQADEVRKLFDRGPFLGAEAVEAGLVDSLAFRDEVYERVKEQAGEGAKLLYLSPYLDRAGRPHRRGDTVALIHGYGTVLRGRSQYSPIDGSVAMGSDTVAGAFRAAIDDAKVKAILFRVDSPGGSAVASDAIWRETIRAREAGKPVIVSMGNVAASGGYWVSMDAHKIVAQPGTITASIGVLYGKMLTTGFWDKLGISWDGLSSSANAGMWTGTRDYTEYGLSRREAFLDRIYRDFTRKVAEGRKMSPEEVEKVARGRIWTGEDALSRGLVDELGGYATALRLVREAIGVDPDAPLRVKVFPRKRSPLDLLLGKKADSSDKAARAALHGMLRELQPHLRMLARVTGWREPQVLERRDLNLAP